MEAFPLLALLLAAMASVQCGAAIAKSLFAELGPAGATALRLTIAAFILGIAFRPWRRLSLREALPAIAPYGAALGAMNLTFYFALSRLPLGLAVAIEFVGPLGVALLGSRRPTDVLWAILAGIGVLTVLPLAGAGAADPLGVAFALIAGACWGLYIVLGRGAGSVSGATTVVSAGMVVAAVVGAPLGLIRTGARLLTPPLLAKGCAVAVLSSVLPYSLEMTVLPRLPARTFGILMSLEPAVAALIGFLALGEQLHLRQASAIACIIVASLGSMLTSRAPVAEAPPA